VHGTHLHGMAIAALAAERRQQMMQVVVPEIIVVPRVLDGTSMNESRDRDELSWWRRGEVEQATVIECRVRRGAGGDGP
jgi:hypothetical protein